MLEEGLARSDFQGGRSVSAGALKALRASGNILRHEEQARISAEWRKEQEASNILCRRRRPSTALHMLGPSIEKCQGSM